MGDAGSLELLLLAILSLVTSPLGLLALVVGGWLVVRGLRLRQSERDRVAALDGRSRDAA